MKESKGCTEGLRHAHCCWCHLFQFGLSDGACSCSLLSFPMLILLGLVLALCAVLRPRYSWGRDAPTMQFQKGVGFSVGRGSPAAWVVMAVHYSEAATGAEVAGLKLR